MQKIKIVILGGGFAGVAAALGLEKNISDAQITLVDAEPYHQFSSNLYEAATAAEEAASIFELKKSIALPFSEIFTPLENFNGDNRSYMGSHYGKRSGFNIPWYRSLTGFKRRRVNFVQGEVKSVDSGNRILNLAAKKIEYDYLLVALGSSEECFNIPGAKEFGLPLKNFSQALKIKNALEFAVEAHKMDAQKKYVRVVVAGGGYTGVEFAGELKGLMDFLCWKHGYPRQKIEILVIEASNGLMPGMGEKATRDAGRRLNELGVGVKLLSPITSVTQNTLELLTGERIVYDALIWTAGVRAKALPQGLSLDADAKGRVKVDEFLRLTGEHNIFILGDQVLVMGKDGKPAPQSAQDAIHQGKYLANALPLLIKNRRPLSYVPKPHGFIVSIGGKWAILNYPPFYFTGRLAYFVHELAHVRYFASLLGLWKALKLVWFQDRLYSRND